MMTTKPYVRSCAHSRILEQDLQLRVVSTLGSYNNEQIAIIVGPVTNSNTGPKQWTRGLDVGKLHGR